MDQLLPRGLQPLVEVTGLTYRYPNGRIALRDVSFAIQPGEIVALIGPNGAGKTTLMLHLNGLLPGETADAGSNGPQAVRIAGLQVTRKNFAEVRRQVGFLFQDPDDQLFRPTVREDVAFGPLNLALPRDEVLRRVSETLSAVGLAGFEERSTQQLSFGERKRVCLAGILACHPTVLALDEPSSNLDPRARRRFMQLLRSCSAAQLIATHDLELVRELCTRVLVLDQGRLQADGPTEQILADARLLERHGLEVPLSIQY
ncbi:MAG TPA: ABC transporter ATP-binding protein, partial [Planctomycetaceae bacterium]|nr:ABC transporter ATP-binding protein [Planctomycetaceae bacterium]